MSRSIADPRHALALLSEGLTVAEVARELRCTRWTVGRLLKQARAERVAFDAENDEIPRLRPRFPRGPFTPQVRCECERTPIRLGSRDYCPVCHKSGLDYLRYFKGVQPLPKDPKQGPETQAPKLTRKARRRLQYARSEAERARRVERRLVQSRAGRDAGLSRPAEATV